jgi:hypothetical protein
MQDASARTTGFGCIFRRSLPSLESSGRSIDSITAQSWFVVASAIRGERFVLYQAVREYFVCTALTECIPKIAVQALGCTASLARFSFRPKV